jgi:hypothetical protein
VNGKYVPVQTASVTNNDVKEPQVSAARGFEDHLMDQLLRYINDTAGQPFFVYYTPHAIHL